LSKAGCICPKIWAAFPDTPTNVRDALTKSICRQARRKQLNTKSMSAQQILSAVTKLPGFKDNSENSKEPGNSGVPDKQVPISEYEDLAGCTKRYTDMGVSEGLARSQCESQLSKSKGGRKTYPTVKTSETFATSSGSVSEEIEIPGWAQTMIGGPPNLLPSRNTSNIRSAKEDRDHEINMYIQARTISHPDSLNKDEADERLERLVYERGNELANKAEQHRLRQAAKKPVEVEKPYWAYALFD
jgi:hypothetical protein